MTFLLGALVLGAVVDLASVVHDVAGLDLLERYAAGSIQVADLEAWDTTFALTGILQTIVFIGTAILWLAWQYRLVSSVAPLGEGEPVKTPGKSVLWWFVPLANIVVVYRIYKDLQATFAPGSGSIVGVWWGVYLVAGAITNIAGRYWLTVDTETEFRGGLILWLVADIASILSALVAVRLVRRLQAGQDAEIAAARAEPLAPDPAVAPAAEPGATA